jgi:hypothetical protein
MHTVRKTEVPDSEKSEPGEFEGWHARLQVNMFCQRAYERVALYLHELQLIESKCFQEKSCC